MIAACVCLILALFLDIREPFHSILMVAGIILFSLSTSVFIVSLLVPWVAAKRAAKKSKAKQKNI